MSALSAPGHRLRAPIRFRVAGMLFVTIAINYLDRSNLSVAATALAHELGLGPVRLGLVFSAFGWAYACFQIPGGWLVDRFGPRPLYASICALWSLATLILLFFIIISCR